MRFFAWKKGRSIFQMESSTLFSRCTTMEYVLLSFRPLYRHLRHFCLRTVELDFSFTVHSCLSKFLSWRMLVFRLTLRYPEVDITSNASVLQLIICIQQVTISLLMPILRGGSITSVSRFVECCSVTSAYPFRLVLTPLLLVSFSLSKLIIVQPFSFVNTFLSENLKYFLIDKQFSLKILS